MKPFIGHWNISVKSEIFCKKLKYIFSLNWNIFPGIVGLANTVDHALHEFNIDGKGCMAKSMCDILYGEDSEQRGMIVKAIANSASK